MDESGPKCPAGGDSDAAVTVLTLKDKRPQAVKEAAWDAYRARVAAWTQGSKGENAPCET